MYRCSNSDRQRLLTRTTYFARVTPSRPAEDPVGLFRVVHSVPSSEQVLRRDLRWHRTAALTLNRMGQIDYDYVEITEEEAARIVASWTEKWSSPSATNCSCGKPGRRRWSAGIVQRVWSKRRGIEQFRQRREGAQLSDAIEWAFANGRPSGAPVISRENMIAHYGEKETARLLDEMQPTLREVMEIPIDWNDFSWDGAGDHIMDTLRNRHPELSEAALGSLRGYFMFQTK